MTTRDLAAVFAGATIGSFLGWAATLRNPAEFMFWAVVVSLALFGLFASLELLRRAWLSAHVTPLAVAGDRLVFRVGVRSHGYRAWGAASVNVLVPDNAGLAEWVKGQDSRERISFTDESIDGQRASNYWQKPAILTRGSHLVSLSVAADMETLPVRVRVDAEYRDLDVDVRAINVSHDEEFARVRPAIFGALGRLPLVSGRFGDI